MNYILFDDSVRETLKPLTYTRPVCEIRVGIMTIREKWEKYLNTKTSTFTEDYLSVKYPIELTDAMMLINGSICPVPEMVKVIKKMTPGQTLVCYNDVIAMYKTKEGFLSEEDDNGEKIEYKGEFVKLKSLCDIFLLNDSEIRKDFEILTNGRKSQKLSSTNTVLGKDIFVEKGAKVECATLNSTTGPIYIGKDCEIMENAAIRGPFAMCDNSIVRLSAKIYGATTLGPYCKVGGELENVVMFGYSNKAHDGFFGNCVIGEWCNIGADSNASNLKNTYEEVRLWSIEKNTFVPSGTMFCGTIMADHSKCGINTMFNTGTVVGVSSNIYGHGYQRNYIPSFVWGGNSGIKVYEVEKAIEVAEKVEKRRDMEMSDDDKRILLHVYRLTLKNKRQR
jgi:UDP-N-acetylglucosamine diphosphorylase/glucosamine-1-phosphate N-acetyltransferase